jgi:MFS transporter, DHA1 family, tetracycline resistance protein
MSAALMLIVGMITLAFAGTATVMVLGICIISAAVAVNNPSISSLASQYALPGQQGATLGFAQSAGGVARAIAPFWIGSLIDKFSARAPLLCSVGAAALVLVVVANLVNINAKRASESGAAP